MLQQILIDWNNYRISINTIFRLLHIILHADMRFDTFTEEVSDLIEFQKYNMDRIEDKNGHGTV